MALAGVAGAAASAGHALELCVVKKALKSVEVGDALGVTAASVGRAIELCDVKKVFKSVEVGDAFGVTAKLGWEVDDGE